MHGDQDEIDFDEDWYLLTYPDVAGAVQRDEFTSGFQHYQIYGGAEGRKPHGRAGKIAIITMVYNESVNLPIWIGHYRRTAPSASLFVIDHSSDDGSTDNLHDINKISLPRDRLDECDRVFLITSLQQSFLRYYEIVIYADCDELLVPDPAISSSLEVHLNRSRYACASAVGFNVIHNVDAELPIDVARPLLLQRRFGQFHSQLCKPLITRVPLIWEPGFHACNQPINIDKDLYLFHTKQIDRDQALRRQRLSHRFSWSRRAVEAGHWAHHRYNEERFLREFFVDRANELRHSGAREFAFNAEIAKLQEQSREISGVFHIPEFTGPIVEIPERFRTVF